jgi:SAM domain (Sterile alpha motif)
MDTAAWLRGLGLEQYAPAFRDNDVDDEVLPSLTADDLINIGVKSVGHRRKLLDAIAAFHTEPSSPREGRVGAKAERRQLTVMFLRSRRVDPTLGAVRSRGSARDNRRIPSCSSRCCKGL